MGTKKLFAVELILDWNLWPRHNNKGLDQTNLKRIKDAIESGQELPPVIASAKDLRVVDGFHRVTAHLQIYGEKAEINVILKDYKDEKEMFLESMRLNSIHGLSMSPLDKIHAILKARRMRIPLPVIAETLGMTSNKAEEYIQKRTAVIKSTNEIIPLPGGAKDLAGKELDDKQAEYVKASNGNVPMMHASMLLKALRARGTFDLTEKNIEILKNLKAEIERVIRGTK